MLHNRTARRRIHRRPRLLTTRNIRLLRSRTGQRRILKRLLGPPTRLLRNHMGQRPRHILKRLLGPPTRLLRNHMGQRPRLVCPPLLTEQWPRCIRQRLLLAISLLRSASHRLPTLHT
jgi:hypothetical protein